MFVSSVQGASIASVRDIVGLRLKKRVVFVKTSVILVDPRGNEVGQMEKLEAHEKGLLHRAFSIFVFNSKGEVLLQKRAITKYHSGGLWANSCCSHPRPGEDINLAVHRRLQEEVGFDCPLRESFSFVYKKVFDNGLTEYEFDHVFTGSYDGPVTPNPEEAEEHKWVPWHEFVADIQARPNIYAFWVREIIRILHDRGKLDSFVKGEAFEDSETPSSTSGVVVYDKLVRDAIPEYIEKLGHKAVSRILSSGDYQKFLHKKLQEEVDEFLEEPCVEELADVLEVVYALAKVIGVSREELEGAREKKVEERGAFEKGVFLDVVYKKV